MFILMFMRSRALLLPFIALAVLAADPALAGPDDRAPERISFQKGRFEATVKGSVAGYGYRDYVIGARAHQVMSIRLRSANMYTDFRIVSINGRPDEELMPAEGRTFSDELSESGDYMVRVKMMRVGARKKNSFARFTLEVSVR